MADAPKKRPFFQLHLSTCVVLMLVAGGLLWANLTPKYWWEPGLTYYAGGVGEGGGGGGTGYRGRGWPWIIQSEMKVIDNKKKQLLRFWTSEYCPFDIKSLCLDSGVFLSILFFTAIALESFGRRKQIHH